MTHHLGKTKFQLDYYKENVIANLETLNSQYEYSASDESIGFKPFAIQNMQNYNPIYSQFFEMNEQNCDRVCLKHRNRMIDLHTVMDTENVMVQPSPSFIKFSPLLDPVKYMIGKYDVSNDAIRRLPQAIGNNLDVFPKLVNYNNAAYIDGFFSFLTSQMMEHHGVIHGLDYYGSYLGVQEKYKMNVADDIEYISASDYFHANLGKHFLISDKNYLEYSSSMGGSRANKNKLHVSALKDEIDLGEIDLLGEIQVVTDEPTFEEHEIVYDKSEKLSDNEESEESDELDESEESDELDEYSPSESSCHSSDSEVEYSDSEQEVSESGSNEEDDESDADTEDDADKSTDESEEDRELFAYIHNFPVQMICLEKCKGTMDSLFEKGLIDETTGAAALMQIIMTLVIYQKAFSFTHNDLHTNNIMYIDTDIEYLYYIVEGKTYRVPTYGKIFKIIDFGRGIYKFNGKQFCSDSFAPGGDAATQYNCEPYMNENKPRLEPNPSFDLCRLACSMYDFVIDDDENLDDMDDFQKVVLKWCTDDYGKNVLYKRNGEERYPNFKLYKMIARTVHGGIPKEQLVLPLFSQYLVDSVDVDIVDMVVVMNIDDIPVYV